jgi:cell division protein FtsB
MSIGRVMKRRVKDAVPPLLFMLLTAYFLWSAMQGDRGLREYPRRQQDLQAAQADLTRARAEQAAWDRRVDALRRTHLDRDALDERSRAMLNLSDPTEIIIPYGNGQRLF